MKHFSKILAVVVLCGFAAVGCGKKKDGAVNATVPAVCSQGQLYSSQYNSCLIQSNQCGSGYGWYSGTNSCVIGVPYTGGGYGTYPPGTYPPVGGGYGQNLWMGTMVITNHEIYKDLLRRAGMCSRGLINFGSEKCKHYAKGGRIEMMITGSTVRVSLVSQRSTAGYSGPASIYNGWIPTGYNPSAPPAAYAPLVFTAQIGTQGSYLAFESYSGLSGYFSTATVSNNMSVQLVYSGRPFARATMIRAAY